MILYRISACKYIESLDGTGARLYGGRWNSKGHAMVYLASSRALAMLEVLVHLQPLLIPQDFCIAEIEVPDKSIHEIDTATLPKNWIDVSPPVAIKQIGNKFIKDGKQLLLKVPSSIVEQEFNYLINPDHPEIKSVKVLRTKPFSFDERLIH
ncbi:RES family NAD+ phosphorylase [Mucilaginibacter gilvus]|uniref:RES domain-containing protein n=1 Tax=Mucilaginibacter gilvus TaxID=2305909 RepID=A0A444MMQ3_9SPHI|nr:RES family NAD+ phosphorylase [Mucilaginibacter gilvus]RWY50991.1 RES domain-containing protein [Mucilaginibacter gilvus]